MLIGMQPQPRPRRAASTLFIALVLALTASTASAQEQPSFLGDTFKKVILDPTTYAPAVIGYDATMRDWNTSQPFFRRGYLERNERYTISGHPNDRPMSYADGRRQVLKDAVMNVEVSLAANIASRTFERVLLDRYPHRRKLVRAVGWVQRIALGSYLSYRLSEAHYRQAGENTRLAAQRGYKTLRKSGKRAGAASDRGSVDCFSTMRVNFEKDRTEPCLYAFHPSSSAIARRACSLPAAEPSGRLDCRSVRRQ